MSEEDPGIQAARQGTLHDVVRSISATHSGAPLEEVEQVLRDGIAAAGFSRQPEPWLSSTAAEISQARHVIVDRHVPGARDAIPDEPAPDETGGH